MSKERIMEILERFDLSPIESIVYIYLAKAGCNSAEVLSSNLGLRKKQLHSVLRKLEEKRIVISCFAKVKLFSVISFDELLDRVVESDNEKAKLVKETKKEVLDIWREITKESTL
jgi:sugar-specific transcriptional regulator TrmB